MKRRGHYAISRFRQWMLRRILLQIVRDRHLDWLFDQIYETHRLVFHEDNHFDREAQLHEELQNSLNYQLWSHRNG